MGVYDEDDYVVPDSPEEVPQVLELGGAVGRVASHPCMQGAHDLCIDDECDCRCHEPVGPPWRIKATP